MSEQELNELKIRNKISEIFLTVPDENMYVEVLNVIIKALKSEFGTFGYFNEEGSFVTPAITRKIYWDKCQVKDKEFLFKKADFSGIWKKSLENNKTYYINSGPFNTPVGHISIKNTIVTPVVYKDKAISIVHLANKNGEGYSEEDCNLLEAITRHLAPVLAARLEIEKREIKRRKEEEKLKKITHDLGERVKELNCLYGISKLVEKENNTIEEILKGTVGLIPPSCQYSEITCACIILDGQSFKTNNFKETEWLQSKEIIVSGEKAGVIEVYYLEEKPEFVEGPFLKEERALINALAEQLGRIVERIDADKKRKEAEENREELIKELQNTLAEVKTLRGILPLCSYCKKNRDDSGYWEQVDVYIHKYSGADISHSICPKCMKEHYPEEYESIMEEKKS